MLTCKDVSKLVSTSLDSKLPRTMRMRLWMHLAMCRLCSRFQKDLLCLRDRTHENLADIDDGKQATPQSLSPEARQRIQRAIDSKSS